VFLVGGVPSGWRNLTLDSRENVEWKSIYQSFDAIHPWHVGRWASINGFETYFKNTITADAALCAELNILYMPTMCKYLTLLPILGSPHDYHNACYIFLVVPGFSWHNLNKKNRIESSEAVPLAPINSIPRQGGRFMWQQAYRFAEAENISTVWMAQVRILTTLKSLLAWHRSK
jgi:hypothetical protein